MRLIPTGILEEWLAQNGRVDLIGKESEIDEEELLRLEQECFRSHPDYDHDHQFAWAAYTILTRNVVSKAERETVGEGGAGELAAFSRAAGAQAKAFWAMHGKLEVLLTQEAQAQSKLQTSLDGLSEQVSEAVDAAKAGYARAEIELRAAAERAESIAEKKIEGIQEENRKAEEAREVRHGKTLEAYREIAATNDRRLEAVEKSVTESLQESRLLSEDAYARAAALARAVSNTISNHIDNSIKTLRTWREEDKAEAKRSRKVRWAWRIAVAILLGALLGVSIAKGQQPHDPLFTEVQDEGTRVKLFAAGIAKFNFTGTGITCTWNASGRWVGCNVTSGPGAGNSSFNWEDPITGDSGKWASHYAIPATISRVYCSTDTGTVDINFEIRTEDTPNTTGDSVLSADLQCTSTGASSTTFANSSILPNRLLTPIVSATSGTPGLVRVAAIVTPAGAGSAGNASFSWGNPVTGDSGKWQAFYSQAATISKVYCSTDAGTLDLNFQIRTEDAPNTTGTTVLTSSLVCTTSGASTAIILNDSIPADRLLTPIVTSTSGSPGVVRTTVVTQ